MKNMKVESLIPSSISKIILNSIVKGEEIAVDDFRGIITLEQYQDLKQKYNNVLSHPKFSNDRAFPKFLPFYEILKEKYDYITWNIDENNQYNLQLPVQRINNLRPSLLHLLISKNISQSFPYLSNHSLHSTKLSNDELKALSDLVVSIDAIKLKKIDFDLLGSWIIKGKCGEKLTAFIPICPDYSTEKSQSSNYLYRYTVNSLGTSNGIVANKILQILPDIKKFFQRLNLSVVINVCISDFEGFSKLNCEKLRVTKDEFIKRVSKSLIAFQDACEIEVNLFMISDLLGGELSWLETTSKFYSMLIAGEYGKSNVNLKKVKDISRRRKSLYTRWLGERESFEDYMLTTLAQAAEYAAMGEAIHKNFENCLIVGADNSAMRYFYNFTSLLPMLYVRPFYD